MTSLALGIERPSRRRLLGIALAAAGALVLLDPTRLEASGRATLGNLMFLGNCVCYSFFLVLMRPQFERIPWRTLIAWSFLFGTIGTLVLSAPALARTEWGSLSSAVAVGIVYIALAPTDFNFALNTWAVRRSSPALVAAFTTLQPVLTTALAATLLHERGPWHQALGFLLIVGGLVVVSGGARRLASSSAAEQGDRAPGA